MPVNLFPRLRIVSALLGAMILVSILPLLFSHIQLVRINRKALEISEEKYLSRSAVTLAADTGLYVKNIQTQLRKTSDALKLAGSIAPDKDPFRFLGQSELMADYVRTEPAFLVLRALDRDGQGSFVQPASIDPAIEAELTRCYNASMRGETVVGEPVRTELFPDGGFVASVPVVVTHSRQGVAATEIIGVVEAFVSLSPVKAWLADEKRRDVVAYIVDRRGNLLLASDPIAVPQKEPLQSVELVGEFIAHPVRMTKSYSRGTGENRRRVLGTVAPVDSPDWGVIVEKDEARAFASVSQMTKASSIGVAIALLFAIIVATLAARALSRPLIEMVGKVRQIAEGNFKQRVELRGTLELVELGETFNAMSDSLEKSVEKLKLAAKENQELFINSIRTLAAAIDAKDPYTRGHSERVARYSVVLARHLNLPAEEIKKVRISALLHDVGKIGIDDRILRKPTALTDEEFEVMKTHPVKGALIINQIPQLRDVIPGIKHHHEKWEGGGYPDGLVREGIPFMARIVTVADTFDAMTTTRPYQKAMALDYVVSRIRSFSGTRFDPVVIAALEKAYAMRDLEVVGEAARVLAVSA
ncbi:MAG: HD domain-containing phosphohydrolase [Thermoanaerobaculia bacterium]